MPLWFVFTGRLAAVAAILAVGAALLLAGFAAREQHSEAVAVLHLAERQIGLQTISFSAEARAARFAPDLQALSVAPPPGMCLTYTPAIEAAAGAADVGGPRTCTGSETGRAAPRWFAAVFSLFDDPGMPIGVDLTTRDRTLGRLSLAAEPGAAVARAWGRIEGLIVLSVLAVLVTAAVALPILRAALRPVDVITAALADIPSGAAARRLPAFDTREFRRIGEAVNRMTDRLLEGEAERAALTRRLFEVQEQERAAVARDLHDEVAQALTAIRALAHAAGAVPDDAQAVGAAAGAIERTAADLTATLREALRRLRPPDLDHLGLAASIAGLAESWNRTLGPGTHVVARSDGTIDPADPTVAVNLYRIAQEALTNAARHAGANNIVVTLGRAAQGGGGTAALRLVVADDGAGLRDRAGAPAGRDTGSTGVGMLGIRERVRALGGRLSVETGRSGTVVTVEIPAAIPAEIPVGAPAAEFAAA